MGLLCVTMSKERLIPAVGKITREQKEALYEMAKDYRRRPCTHIGILLADIADVYLKSKKSTK